MIKAEFRTIGLLLFALLLIAVIWLVLGFNPDLIIGVNDISHHLLTLKLSSFQFPFFTPLYDWLWSGGALVAPNVGYIPLEKIFISLGLSDVTSYNLSVISFQALLFIFCHDIFSESEFTFLEKTLAALTICFLPIISLRIIYGHTSLYWPVLFNIILFWLLYKDSYDLFLLIFAFFINFSLFHGPYFQILIYSLFLVWPFIFYYFRTRIKQKLFFIGIFYFICLWLSLDYIWLTFSYVKSADIFRSLNIHNLVYSYAKLRLLDIVDFFTTGFANPHNYPFYLLHEVKAHVGLFPLFFLLVQLKKRAAQRIYLAGIFLVLLFIFGPWGFETFFSHVPLLNMFRIPQRSLLAILPLIYLAGFLLISKNSKHNTPAWINYLFFFFALISGWLNLLALDFVVLLLLIAYFFGSKYKPSRLCVIASLFVSCFFFLQFHPYLFSEKIFADSAKLNSPPVLARQSIASNKFWNINATRAANVNSAFGYTHPLARFRFVYSEMFDPFTVDPIIFPAHRDHPLYSNYLHLYRYGADELLYAPSLITNDFNQFQKELLSPDSFLIKKSFYAYIENIDPHLILPSQVLCFDKISLGGLLLDNQVLSFTFVNPTNSPCMVMVPFNYSTFLSASINHIPTTILNANISQMAISLPPGSGNVVFKTNDQFFWKLRIYSMLSGFVLLGFFLQHYYNRRLES